MRSLIEADEASRLNGMDALHQTQRAVASVLEALALATSVSGVVVSQMASAQSRHVVTTTHQSHYTFVSAADVALPVCALCPDGAWQDVNKARYGFLVYSASVHHWWVARPLLRPDCRRFAVASFTRVVEALEAANDPNLRWRCQNALTLALCHDECKTTDKALASITMALAHAKAVTDGNAAALLEEVRKLNIYLSRHDVAKTLPAAKDEAKGAARSKYEGVLASRHPRGAVTVSAALG